MANKYKFRYYHRNIWKFWWQIKLFIFAILFNGCIWIGFVGKWKWPLCSRVTNLVENIRRVFEKCTTSRRRLNERIEKGKWNAIYGGDAQNWILSCQNPVHRDNVVGWRVRHKFIKKNKELLFFTILPVAWV